MDKLLINALYAAFDAAKEEFEAAELPPVAHIDKYRGQPLNPEEFEAYELPAVFYEFSIVWSKRGRIYTGQLNITYHVQQDATWETSSISTNREEGLKQIDLLNAIRAVLDNVKCATTSNMTRSNDIPVDSGVTIYDTLGYSCEYTAPQYVPGKSTVTVTPDLKVEGELQDSAKITRS